MSALADGTSDRPPLQSNVRFRPKAATAGQLSTQWTLFDRLLFPTYNVETRLNEGIEHCDSKLLLRFWQEPQRPQTVCDFRSYRSRQDGDGFVGEHQDRL